MRDCSQEALEASRPEKSAAESVDFCLQQLYQDRTHTIDQIVAGVMTYEELIGALLLARDDLRAVGAKDYRYLLEGWGSAMDARQEAAGEPRRELQRLFIVQDVIAPEMDTACAEARVWADLHTRVDDRMRRYYDGPHFRVLRCQEDVRMETLRTGTYRVYSVCTVAVDDPPLSLPKCSVPQRRYQ
jgi:hypothetical protein